MKKLSNHMNTCRSVNAKSLHWGTLKRASSILSWISNRCEPACGVQMLGFDKQLSLETGIPSTTTKTFVDKGQEE